MPRTDDRTFHARSRDGALLIAPYLADGLTPGGIAVVHDERKMPGLALVLDANDAALEEGIRPGDRIVFAEGQHEPLLTATLESLAWLRTAHVIDVLPDEDR